MSQIKAMNATFTNLTNNLGAKTAHLYIGRKRPLRPLPVNGLRLYFGAPIPKGESFPPVLTEMDQQ